MSDSPPSPVPVPSIAQEALMSGLLSAMVKRMGGRVMVTRSEMNALMHWLETHGKTLTVRYPSQNTMVLEFITDVRPKDAVQDSTPREQVASS